MVIRRSLNILLSLLILLSTMGISISRHYCGSILKDSAVFVHAEGCGDMEDMPMDCCHDEVDHFELQDDFQTAQFSFDFDHKFTVQQEYFDSILENSHRTQEVNLFPNKPPPPPLIDRTIFKEVQSFLI